MINEHDRSTGANWIGAMLCMGLAFAFTILVSALWGGRRSTASTNADAIQSFMVARDVMNDPSSLLTWYHSPSLYVFPDWIVSGLLQWTPIAPQLLPVIYCALMLTAYSAGSGYLIAASTGRGWLNSTLVSSLALALLFLWVATTRGLGADITMHLPAQYFHTGALVVGLAVLGCMCAFVREPAINATPFVLSVVLCVAGAHSDAILLFWFVLPSSVVYSAFFLLQRKRPPLLFPAATLAATLAGIATDRLTRQFPTELGSSLLLSLRTWRDLLTASLRNGEWPFPLALAISVIMLARALFLARELWRRREGSVADLAEALLVGCVWAAILLPIASRSLVHESLIRYSLPLFLLPYIWVSLVLVRYAHSSLVRYSGLALSLAWLAISATLFPSAVSATSWFKAPSPLLSCMEKHGLREGYSDYWNSKLIIWHSEYAVHLVQLTSEANPYRFNFNERWFTTNALTGKPIEPNFIVPTRLDPEMLRAKFGPPAAVMQCGREEIWTYSSPLPTFPR